MIHNSPVYNKQKNTFPNKPNNTKKWIATREDIF